MKGKMEFTCYFICNNKVYDEPIRTFLEGKLANMGGGGGQGEIFKYEDFGGFVIKKPQNAITNCPRYVTGHKQRETMHD